MVSAAFVASRFLTRRRFARRRLVSTGSNDRAVIVFRFKDLETESKRKKDEVNAYDESLIPASQLKLVRNFEEGEKIQKEENLRRSLKDPFRVLRQSMGVGGGGGGGGGEEVRRFEELSDEL